MSWPVWGGKAPSYGTWWDCMAGEQLCWKRIETWQKTSWAWASRVPSQLRAAVWAVLRAAKPGDWEKQLSAPIWHSLDCALDLGCKFEFLLHERLIIQQRANSVGSNRICEGVFALWEGAEKMGLLSLKKRQLWRALTVASSADKKTKPGASLWYLTRGEDGKRCKWKQASF